MSAPIIRTLSMSGNLFRTITFSGVPYQTVRYAAKKSNSAPRNIRKHTHPKKRGAFVEMGSFVHKDHTIVRQLGLKYYPGQYVGFGPKNSLVALKDGKVIVTAEQLSPYPNSPLYEPVKKGKVFTRLFFHVIPVPLYGQFRLVSQI